MPPPNTTNCCSRAALLLATNTQQTTTLAKPRMSMYSSQCQDAARNAACTTRRVCGKEDSTAALQHAILFALRMEPTLSTFLSPAIANVLVEKLGLETMGGVEQDVQAIMYGA